MAGYGLADEAARLRAAQIVAAALGWRIFEDYLVQAGGLEAIPLATLREELARFRAPAGRHALALAARPPAAHALTSGRPGRDLWPYGGAGVP